MSDEQHGADATAPRAGGGETRGPGELAPGHGTGDVSAGDPPAGGSRSADPLSADPLSADPLHGDPRVADYFGDAYPRVLSYATMLADQGVLRGLIGPRELDRIWERHILNSAALVPFLRPGVVADVGSGAGLPGMVIAAMQPDRRVVLVEPMERRTAWLLEAARETGIDNAIVVRGRAEEVQESVEADVITARAVASIDKLVKWCAPLLSADGEMVFLKGRSASAEVDKARHVLRKHGLTPEVRLAPTIDGVEPTTVVRLARS